MISQHPLYHAALGNKPIPFAPAPKHPAKVVANFYWEWEDDDDIRKPSDQPNLGRFDHLWDEECGCQRAVYTLDLCGGPADLLISRCDDFGGPFCGGHYFDQVDGGRGGFKIEVAS